MILDLLARSVMALAGTMVAAPGHQHRSSLSLLISHEGGFPHDLGPGLGPAWSAGDSSQECRGETPDSSYRVILGRSLALGGQGKTEPAVHLDFASKRDGGRRMPQAKESWYQGS